MNTPWIVLFASIALCDDATPEVVTQPTVVSATQLVLPTIGVLALDRKPVSVELTDVLVRTEVSGERRTESWTCTLTNLANRPNWAQLLLAVPKAMSFVPNEPQNPSPAQAAPEVLDEMQSLDLLMRMCAETGSRRPIELAGRSSIYVPHLALGAGESLELTLNFVSDLLLGPDHRIEITRSEMPTSAALPFHFELHAADPARWSWVHSASHELIVERRSDGLRAELASAAFLQPGPLVVLLGAARPPMGLCALTESAPDGSTYFTLFGRLADLPATDDSNRLAPAREMTLVVDTSGSMAGSKIRQAQQAALQFLASLGPGDRFQLIRYADEPTKLFEAPSPAVDANFLSAEQFIAALQASGSTHLSGALSMALASPVEADRLPYVLVLSDGLPTKGVTDEAQLVSAARSWNTDGRRLYTFGIGHDVNASLLDALAHGSRGESAYVAPEEDVEQIVATCVRGLELPRLSSIEVSALESGTAASGRWQLVPSGPLPDLFDGEVLFVQGRISGTEPIELVVAGRSLEGQVQSSIHIHPTAAAHTGGALGALFVARRSGELLDRIRSTGATQGNSAVLQRVEAEMAELLRLGLQSGLLNSYTSFLALHDTDLMGYSQMLERLAAMLTNRVVQARIGRAVFEDARAIGADRDRQIAERVRSSLASGSQALLLSNVVHLCGHGFFRRGETWIDGGLLGPGSTAKVDEYLTPGSQRATEVLQQLAGEGRAALLALQGSVVFEHGGQVLSLGLP